MPLGLNLGLGITSGAGSPVASGDFTDIAVANAAEGVYTLNGSPAEIGDIVDVTLTSQFDPADVDEGGLFCPEIEPGLWSSRVIRVVDPLKSTLLASGYTVVWEFYAATAASISIECQGPGLVSGGGSANQPPFVTNSFVSDGPGDFYTQDDVNYIALGQVNKLAITVIEDNVSLSLNGLPVIETGGGNCLDPTMTALKLQFSGEADERIRSFAFYEPVDNADLPALSAL